MAAPITWRTIESNPIGEISRAMTSGQAGINLGFDSFQKILDRQQATDNANWNQAKTNQTNNFMNEVAGIQTPEELAAAEGRLRQSLVGNAQIDQQAARQALGARLGQLQERTLANQKFGDTQLDREQAGIKDQHAALVAQGRHDEANALLENNVLRNEGAMYKSGAEAKRASILQERADTTYNRGEELAKITHPEAVRAAGDEAQSGALLRLASAAQQSWAQESNKRSIEVGDIARGLKLPVTVSGHPMLSEMADDSKAKLFAEMKAKGIANPETYLKGDTGTADKFYDGLVASGKFSPEILAKNKAAIRAGFDPSVASGAVGVEAADKALAAARTKVSFDEKDATNWYAPGSPDANKGYEQLSAEVPKLINSTSGLGTEEDVADLQKFIHEMATKGIETEPGSGKFVTPSVNDMRNAIRTAEGGWFKDSTRASNARDIIRNNMKDPEVVKKIKEGQDSTEYRFKQKVKAEIGSK